MPAQAFNDPLDPGLLGEPFQILAQSLSDVGAHQGLISGETEKRSDLLELVDNILREKCQRNRSERP